ncbi:23S rRNA (adenine(1618)-N(6))-methyltransferase [Ranunculus cassubicifolius]
MPNKRKKRKIEQPTIHPRNRYSENPPDFGVLASLYPSFEQFVFYTRDGRPRIDWTDFNATRELTRVLLDHDHGVKWWIPDGQLCPTVPNRSNYIHWIEDLLSSDIIPKTNATGEKVRGFDIGTGANCIYPLLGASLLGWSFVGSDVTDVALEWARRNVSNNPHLSELIEIRKADNADEALKEVSDKELISDEIIPCSGEITGESTEIVPPNLDKVNSDLKKNQGEQQVLLGVVRNDEQFDFCMCNPPFFESMEEAGLNPKTSCGGTPEEMVCPGGERSFIMRIIDDSVSLKQSFRWYTSMIGRKANLKVLVSKLWEVGASVVKTTEFVQGETCRWGLAWSFLPPVRNVVTSHVTEKNNLSFMLEGIPRQFSAIDVLKSVESHFLGMGATCKSNPSLFLVDVTPSTDFCDSVQKKRVENFAESSNDQKMYDGPNPMNEHRFRLTVFQQIPGTLLLKGSLQHRGSSLSGVFSLIIQQLEEHLKKEFGKGTR